MKSATTKSSDPKHHYHISRRSGNWPGEPPVAPTFGVMLDRFAMELCKSMERAWVDADKDGHRDEGVSRSVAGLFNAVLRKSKDNGGDGSRHYDVFQFKGVPDIEAMQLHIANHMEELKGCVALGTAQGVVDGDELALQGSKSAYDKWHKDALALCAAEGLDPEVDGIWILITDDMPNKPKEQAV